MRKIILHPGFPKTGTTTLQRHLFPAVCRDKNWHYLGNSYDENAESSIDSVTRLAKLRRILFRRDELYFITNRKELFNAFFPRDGKNILLSSEGLIYDSFRYRVDDGKLLVSDALSTLRKFLILLEKTEFSDIKIVLLIRNQRDLIPSIYAQSYMHYYRKIRELDNIDKFISQIKSGRKYSHIFSTLYYFQFLQEIIGLFGKENVNISYCEDLFENHVPFVKNIHDLIGDSFTLNNLKQENVRRDSNKWYTQSFSVSDYCDSSGVRAVKSFMKPIFSNKYSDRIGSIVLKNRKEIHYHPHHANTVFEHFKDSNMYLMSNKLIDSRRDEYMRPA